MKTFFSSLLIVFATLFAAPAYADDACRNLLPASFMENSTYDTVTVYGVTRGRAKVLPTENGKVYTLSVNYATTAAAYYYIYKISQDGTMSNPIYFIVQQSDTAVTSNTTITLSTLNNEKYIVTFANRNSLTTLTLTNYQLEEGSTATAYQPYNPLCATCDGTIVNYTSVTENDVPAGVQNGTPTPTNPIEPVFYTQGDMVLRRIGDYADSYDATTGKITRRVGVKVLDGTETGWGATSVTRITGVPDDGLSYSAGLKYIFSHFNGVTSSTSLSEMQNYDAKFGTPAYPRDLIFRYREMQNVEQWRNWLAEQYANGTPVTVYYPLATPVEEDWPSSYCQPTIRIATTAYNAARFSPVVTDLNTTIATIREIVTNTINQTAAIASLQADKQTRPEDACPAGKKCLLVETEENGVIVPHWFPIIEAPTD